MNSTQKSMGKYWLFNKYELIAMSFVLMQQLIVASSTIWITRLITNLQDETFLISLLVLYLGSLTFPYIPGAISLIFHSKARVVAASDFLNQFTERYQGKITEWTNDFEKSKKSSMLSAEATQTLAYSLDYFHNFLTSALNVFLNLLVISVIVEPFLLVTYAVGVLLCFTILRFQKKIKRILTLRAQQGRIKWVSMLLKAWDNILLNNLYNMNLWRAKTNSRTKRLISSTVKLETFSQFISVTMAFSLFAPSFFAVITLALIRSNDFTWLAITVVALPRLFQVLSYSYEMLFLLSDYPVQKSRLQTVLGVLETTDESQASKLLESRISWDKISLKSCSQKEFDTKSFVNNLPKVGRYQLRGDNGSGKTTLLLLLKLRAQGSAYYLPTKHDLMFKKLQEKLSTGQKTKTILNELLENLDAPVFLLDEWDANLDSKNRERFDKLIEELSQRACVIESRHLSHH